MIEEVSLAMHLGDRPLRSADSAPFPQIRSLQLRSSLDGG
jgi:hypothetical protein